MSASLVGSEMCIRDSRRGAPTGASAGVALSARARADLASATAPRRPGRACLLYTSDAADDM
eukprot:2651384-Alexandrium_andersonii.AAC.1